MRRNTDDESKRWMAQAKSDLADAHYLCEGKRYNACCFFCQQAAEKAIKAYLYQQGAEHIYGHSVAELCLEASKLDQSFDDIRTAVSPLDVYYIPTRYPNALPGGIPSKAFSVEDAERALAMVKIVIELADKKLS
jgi:HEPN domain-containing protein